MRIMPQQSPAGWQPTSQRFANDVGNAPAKACRLATCRASGGPCKPGWQPTSQRFANDVGTAPAKACRLATCRVEVSGGPCKRCELCPSKGLQVGNLRRRGLQTMWVLRQQRPAGWQPADRGALQTMRGMPQQRPAGWQPAEQRFQGGLANDASYAPAGWQPTSQRFANDVGNAPAKACRLATCRAEIPGLANNVGTAPAKACRLATCGAEISGSCKRCGLCPSKGLQVYNLQRGVSRALNDGNPRTVRKAPGIARLRLQGCQPAGLCLLGITQGALQTMQCPSKGLQVGNLQSRVSRSLATDASKAQACRMATCGAEFPEALQTMRVMPQQRPAGWHAWVVWGLANGAGMDRARPAGWQAAAQRLQGPCKQWRATLQTVQVLPEQRPAGWQPAERSFQRCFKRCG